MILAGDIGGTNTRLAVFDHAFNKRHERSFKNEGRAGLTEIVREFLHGVEGEQRNVDRATFGVAGPVKDGRAQMTNLPWRLDERELARELEIPKIALINDLVAHGEGIELLRPEQLITVQAGEVALANRAVIAAGTGLGEGGIFYDPYGHGGGQWRAFASEGGHCDFSPRDERQIALLRWLRGKYPNASWERVLSGPGLRNVYDFLITPEQLGPGAALAEAEWGGGDGGPRPSKISEAGMKGTNAACVEALNLFAAFYGAEAANVALKVMATGGVYIGGGIALRIIEKLKSNLFLDAFRATGPDNIRAVLRRMPIHIVNCELTGLYGAANFAAHL
jgi:glucokinase